MSDIAGTFAWFEKWGWRKLWDWGTPPTFGAVGSGKETCIFLCQGAQGGRGRGTNTTTFQRDGDEESAKGVWMSVWVDDVDEMHKHCVAVGLKLHFRLPICRGTSARCTFAIPMATCSVSAADSSLRNNNPKDDVCLHTPLLIQPDGEVLNRDFPPTIHDHDKPRQIMVKH